MNYKADIGVFGGSGFYSFLDNVEEIEIPYANIALITDYDAGLEGNAEVKPVTEEEVYRVFKDNNEKVKKVLYTMIEKIQL